MATSLIIILLLILVVIALLYNRLVRSRNRVDTAWSDIDVQLQRRHDLIPNLVQAVEAYAGYERATLLAVTELRAQAEKVSEVNKLGEVEEKLTEKLQRLIALAENYPELKADQNFLQLQGELVETENFLQFARRYYNGAVRDFNNLIETVPSNLVANWFNFSARLFFQKSSDEVSQVPQVKLDSVNNSK